MSHLGYEIKKLGFGLMRLPKRGDNIDVEQVRELADLVCHRLRDDAVQGDGAVIVQKKIFQVQ